MILHIPHHIRYLKLSQNLKHTSLHRVYLGHKILPLSSSSILSQPSSKRGGGGKSRSGDKSKIFWPAGGVGLQGRLRVVLIVVAAVV